eukprot:3970081-Pyramimonas_sp.AAC.1
MPKSSTRYSEARRGALDSGARRPLPGSPERCVERWKRRKRNLRGRLLQPAGLCETGRRR